MNNVKQLRKAAGMSRAALAKKSGIGERTIEMYEQNRRDLKNARAHIVLALAKALDVEPERLWEVEK